MAEALMMNPSKDRTWQYPGRSKYALVALLGLLGIIFLLFQNPRTPFHAVSLQQDSTAHKDSKDSLPVHSAGRDSVQKVSAIVQRVLLETRRMIERRSQLPVKFINDNYLLVIDPGHGGTKYIDKGSSASLDGKEYNENDVAWDYAVALEHKLLSAGYESVKKTKAAAADSTLSIHNRADIANKFAKETKKKIIFISLHWNNFEDHAIKGAEIYIKEKHNFKSRKLAEFIQGGLTQIMGAHGKGLETTGIVERDYKVLREVETGVLIELGFASNPNDLRKIIYQKDDVVRAIFEGTDAFATYLQSLDQQKTSNGSDESKKHEDKLLSALDNQPLEWSWRKADISKSTKDLLKTYNGIYDCETAEKTIYLTFDCGYDNGNTAKILDVLKTDSVKACFFITGAFLKYNKDLVQRMLKDGHVIGNHSQNHIGLPKLNTGEMREEILALEREYYDLFEQKLNYFRPPSGEYSVRSLAVAASLGYKSVFWSLAYDDWDVNLQRGKEYAYAKIMKSVHPGAIVLMHAVSKDNAEAMDSIIKDLRKQGYQFRVLDDIP
jgi:peptidoglycan-N-acetylmuramic acid deacetylase